MCLIDSMGSVESIVLYSVESVVPMFECCLTMLALLQWSYHLSLILSCCPENSFIKRFPTVLPHTLHAYNVKVRLTHMYVLIKGLLWSTSGHWQSRSYPAVVSAPNECVLVSRTCITHSLCLPAAGKPMPMSKDGNAEMHILPVPMTLLSAISTLRINIPNDLRPPEARRATLLTLKVRPLLPAFIPFMLCV